MRLTVDRLEGDLAVCLDGEKNEYIRPLGELSALAGEDVHANDVLTVETDGDTFVFVRIEHEETERILQENRRRLTALFNKKKD